MEYSIEHRENDRRGVFLIEGDMGVLSELTYAKDDDNIITIDHTETKRSEEGKGLASSIMAHTVDYARSHNWKIKPLCPFAEVWMDKHPEHADVRV